MPVPVLGGRRAGSVVESRQEHLGQHLAERHRPKRQLKPRADDNNDRVKVQLQLRSLSKSSASNPVRLVDLKSSFELRGVSEANGVTSGGRSLDNTAPVYIHTHLSTLHSRHIKPPHLTLKMASLLTKAQSALGISNHGLKLNGHPLHGPTGYGLMGLTWRASPPPQEQAFAAMKTALHHGANFWNGGEIYGNAQRNSLHLLQEYFEKYPADAKDGVVVISIKGGCVPNGLKPDGSAENVRRSIRECIDVLGKSGKKLDLWESARVDPDTPIETTMRAAKEFVDKGELGGICLSECSADTIRRASKVVKISAVEVEFSLWATEILQNGVAQACKELDIPIVAYSPLGRGFLTGQIKSLDDIPETDFRRTVPRFSAENFPKNLKLVDEMRKLAEKKGVTPGQIALAWVRYKSGRDGLPVIIPIPGATTAERVAENMVEVPLSENDVKEIDSLLASIEIVGGRYNAHAAHLEFGDSAPLKE